MNGIYFWYVPRKRKCLIMHRMKLINGSLWTFVLSSKNKGINTTTKIVILLVKSVWNNFRKFEKMKPNMARMVSVLYSKIPRNLEE